MGCVTYECYSKHDVCEKICWTWKHHVSRVAEINARCRHFKRFFGVRLIIFSEYDGRLVSF